MLSVRIPGRTSLRLLEEESARFNALLQQVPKELDLWEADEAVIAPGSPASELWARTEKLPGGGWVTAGKLLARKRPRLIPVYDRVARKALGRKKGDGWWLPLQAVLRDNPDLVARLFELRTDSKIGEDISPLRVLDVAIWMQAYGKPEPAPEGDDLSTVE
jgi:hypothetical protein